MYHYSFQVFHEICILFLKSENIKNKSEERCLNESPTLVGLNCVSLGKTFYLLQVLIIIDSVPRERDIKIQK